MHRFNSTFQSDKLAKSSFEQGCENYGINPKKIVYCDHHLSHALVAFYPSEFEDAFVLIADGRGDYRSISCWNASRSNGINHIHSVSELNSLGVMYGYITKLLGFIPDRHEGKVTGLSANGKPSEILDLLKKSIFFDNKSGKVKTIYGDFYLPYMKANLNKLEYFKETIVKEDFAYAAQEILESILKDYLSFYLKKYHPDKKINLCLSGGCFANVKLNFELSKIDQVKNLYVSPEMGDGGNALGGAINCMVKFTNEKKVSMPNVYLGPKFDNEEIIKDIQKNNLKANLLSPDKKIEVISKELIKGKIVGWFSGRMEYGPRALGARSILASPSDPSINNSLNYRLKRTEFMPFAPVTIDSLADSLFKDWSISKFAAKYMTTCYECTSFMKEKCPATVHVDNTARPQIIHRSDNADYYDLIKKFYELSGIPALINTSFNSHEEPIVCNPDEAIKSFLNKNVDILVLENFIIK